jgi:protein-L-isoaspartate O-methyltransferase
MTRPLKALWYRIFRDHPYAYTGRVVVALCRSGYLRYVQQDLLENPRPKTLWRKLIKAGLTWRYFSQDEAILRATNREQFWAGRDGRAWHLMKTGTLSDAARGHDEFENFRAPIVAQLRNLLRSDHAYSVLCEIGTGNGLFVQYLSRAAGLESLRRFVGLDVNREQIAHNRAALATDRLSFECMDVGEWIDAEPRKGTVFLTHDTLHLFTPAEVQLTLGTMRRAARSAIVLSEPIDPRLPATVLSRPRGGIGIGFSHNYAAYLARSGYRIIAEDLEHDGTRIPVPAWHRLCAESTDATEQ